MVFKHLCLIVVLWTKVASALEGLKVSALSESGAGQVGGRVNLFYRVNFFNRRTGKAETRLIISF